MFDARERVIPVLSPCSSYFTGNLFISARKAIRYCVDMAKDGKKVCLFYNARAPIDSADLETERERHLMTGKRVERTKLDFR